MSRMRIYYAVLGAVALLAVAALGTGLFLLWDQHRTDQAREDALTAASRTVTAMFSYEPGTVETELPKAADALTPGFREDYLELINQAIVPGAKEKQLTVKATMQAGGVVSADTGHAVVLLYLNQLTTSKDAPEGQTTGTRVRVSLDKSDDRWLVAQVTPV